MSRKFNPHEWGSLVAIEVLFREEEEFVDGTELGLLPSRQRKLMCESDDYLSHQPPEMVVEILGGGLGVLGMYIIGIKSVQADAI